MDYKNNILEAIGNTPLIKLNKINKGLKPLILAKLESVNPGGSVKDRIGIAMLDDAVNRGVIKPGGTVVEATSGNTGIGLALAAAIRGFQSVFVVTDKVSSEKINYLKALGAQVIVCPNAVKHDSPDYYVNVARKIAAETPNALFMYQYANPANPKAHYETTGPEIWKQTDGKITHFVAGIGTGGTISGVGRYLKEKNPNIKIIGADPVGSILKEYKKDGKLREGVPYLVEGIGQDCIPENIDFPVIDEIINVSDFDSFSVSRALTKEEGIFCGGSTGTIAKAALEIAKDLPEDAVIVFIVCDTGERYLSKMHSEEWLKEKRLLNREMKSLRDLSNAKKNGPVKNLVFLQAKDKVRHAIEVLNTNGFSQIPVIENGQSVGSIREAKVMASLVDNHTLLDATVEEVMGSSFPSLDEKTDLQIVKKHLAESPAVLVLEFGRIIDIVTRYDIIEYASSL
ncbi:MAG: pyridoxal-phosphate dependent enzyme [Ignavibacteria bacterium]|nr:pyridoxal-phosphate dependent enzyme [Ignavibacteria bacterium]OIO23811.1 MAG: cystathionine beta-synthase [Ignavibacteria bacterium CG1_02_37_35]PIS43985.1 MAG: cystathionine beta-synthase [Ignavibacteria bacterium CG08_land_8_20_14_0_20_37_9]PIX94006.1 MAG: cystathionine beta-synthase [Ignavibacteria bacterium CG_4_10_14_3_um_filter_37_18]